MIHLCSSSQTRALLLDNFGVKYIQQSPNYDEEQITTPKPIEFVYTASLGKLKASIKEFGLELPLLCADTVIASSDGEILRKAKDEDDARRILNIQSGSQLSIISSLHYQKKEYLFTNISTTTYEFAPFEQEDMDAYIKSGLWRGKAGACMVEGFCKKYIVRVQGLESNAMGLQVEKLLPWL
ncbi:MAG: septum formation inhibitor Maf [Campylobacterales bacterium]|nr:septum formation inhibitor Maf [Campylobacterales bacterium]